MTPEQPAARPRTSGVRFLNAAVLAFLFATLFWTAFKTPYLADDFGNMAGYYRLAPLEPGATPTLETFLSVPDCLSNLVREVKTHWRHETGRFQSALWLRVLAGMPRWLFALVCAAAWLALFGGIWRMAGLAARDFAPCALASAAFTLNADAGLWLSGTANYLVPAVVTMGGVALFRCAKLGESVRAVRNLWMPVLLPVGVFLGGGHELISLPVCLTLAVYWTGRLVRRDLRVDGRLLLSVGYGIGSALLVFAPSTLSRAGGVAYFAPDAPLLYSAARKAMALIRCCTTNPLLVFALVGTALAIVNPNVRRRLPPSRGLMLAFGCALLVATCGLCDGRNRQGWPMSVAAMLMASALYAFFRAGRGRLAAFDASRAGTVFRAALCLVGVVVCTCTCASTVRRARAFDAGLAQWKSDPCGVFLLDGLAAVPRFGWFDRSFEGGAVFGIGEPWHNPALARFHGRTVMVGLWEADRRILLDDPARGEPLPRVPSWRATAGRDLLYSFTVPEEAAALPAGTPLTVQPSYADVPPRLGVFARLRNRMLREHWAPFSCAAPADEMNGGTPLRGFVMDTPHGRCCVVLHNHHIPRANIRALEIKAAK